MGTLVIKSKFILLHLELFLFRPIVVIDDGPPQTIRWGTTELEVEPGGHQLDIHIKYLWFVTSAKANAYVEIPEGGRATVTYKAPFLLWYMDGKTEVSSTA